MHFSLLTVAAALTGLSAAAPGGGWGDAANFPGYGTSSSAAKTSTSSSTKPAFTTPSFSFPGKPSSSSAAASSSTSKPGFPGFSGKPSSSSVTAASSTSFSKPSIPSGGPSAGFPGGPGSPPTVTVTTTASCAPIPSPSCYLDDAKATQIIGTYEKLISRSIHGAEFNATANALLADSFFTQSNSLNAELGFPLEAISIPNKQVFISVFFDKPATKGTDTLGLMHSCDQIAWRWHGTSPSGNPVRGLTMMNITSTGQVGPNWIEYFRPELYNCSAALPPGTK